MLNLLTEKEKIVWEAIFKEYLKEPGCYVMNKEVKTPFTRKQYSGFISSLQKKGWIYAFSVFSDDDIELTCQALDYMHVAHDGWCNHELCDHLKKREKC